MKLTSKWLEFKRRGTPALLKSSLIRHRLLTHEAITGAGCSEPYKKLRSEREVQALADARGQPALVPTSLLIHSFRTLLHGTYS